MRHAGSLAVPGDPHGIYRERMRPIDQSDRWACWRTGPYRLAVIAPIRPISPIPSIVLSAHSSQASLTEPGGAATIPALRLLVRGGSHAEAMHMPIIDADAHVVETEH